MPSSKRPASSKRETPEAQSQRFIAKAREFGCDEDPEAFERTFSKIVPPKRPRSHAKREKKPGG